MYRAMYLAHPACRESGTLKMTINVAGKYERPIRHRFSHIKQQAKVVARGCSAVQIQTMAVEPPGNLGPLEKGLGACDIFEAQPLPPERRIGAPESLRPSKIKQPKIYAHASTSGDQ